MKLIRNLSQIDQAPLLLWYLFSFTFLLLYFLGFVDLARPEYSLVLLLGAMGILLYVIARNWRELMEGYSSRDWSIVVILLITGLALRLYGLEARSIWQDEDDTIGQILGYAGLKNQNFGLSEIPHRAAANHQGLMHYYLLYPVLSLSGANVFWARFVSVIPGAILGIIAYDLAKKIANNWAIAASFAFLITTQPFFVYYSQEVRPYAWGLLWCFLTIWSLVHYSLKNRDYFLSLSCVFIFFLLMTLNVQSIIFVMYYFVIFLVGRKWKLLFQLFLPIIIGLPFLMYSFQVTNHHYIRYFSTPRLELNKLPWFFYIFFNQSAFYIPALEVIAFLFLLAFVRKDKNRELVKYLLGGLFIFFAVFLSFSFVITGSPPGLRHTLLCAPMMYLALLYFGIFESKKRNTYKWVGPIIFSLATLYNLWILPYVYGEYGAPQRIPNSARGLFPAWQEIFQYFRENSTANDAAMILDLRRTEDWSMRAFFDTEFYYRDANSHAKLFSQWNQPSYWSETWNPRENIDFLKQNATAPKVFIVLVGLPQWLKDVAEVQKFLETYRAGNISVKKHGAGYFILESDRGSHLENFLGFARDCTEKFSGRKYFKRLYSILDYSLDAKDPFRKTLIQRQQEYPR